VADVVLSNNDTKVTTGCLI